jgi:nucleoside-diphosphate-sugar epimerase
MAAKPETKPSQWPLIVVTGAGGFLGSHLCEHYLRRGQKVVGVDNFSTGTPKNIEYLRGLPGATTNFSFFEADVCAPWIQWLQSSDRPLIFHFASPASPPLYQKLAFETMAVNTTGLERAMDWADRFGGRCVFASTSETYGDPLVHPQPESYRGNVNTMGPRSCYDEAKRFGETLVYTRNWKRGTAHGLVRIFNTYGPRMNPSDGRVVINFLVQGLGREPLTVYGDGTQTRSFCFVSDLVNGIARYAESDLTEPVNLGNDREFTILELAQEVRILFGNDLPIVHRALPADDPVKRRPDLKKARELLAGWSPTVPLSEGLRLMLEWLKSTEGSAK